MSTKTGSTSTAPTDPLLTADEVAGYLRVHSNWVYAEAAAGRMPSILVGRRRRFRLNDIDGWLVQRARMA